MKLPVLSGLYKITNIENGHFYIGSSENIYKRWRRHRYELTHQRHHSAYLQRAWDKYGENNFTWELLTLVEPPQLLEEEAFWITVLAPAYNVGSVGGGDNFSNNPKKEEIRLKMSRASLKLWENPAYRSKVTPKPGKLNPNWRGGNWTKRLVCPKCGGKKTYTAKTCIKCRDRSGSANPFWGRKHTPNMKAQLRKLRTGQLLSPETKEKCRQKSVDFYASAEGLVYKKYRARVMSGTNHPLWGVGHLAKTKQNLSVLATERGRRRKLLESLPQT